MTNARRHVSSREEAEDIVLEVFLAALKQPELSRLSEEKQLAWLQRVAYYKFVEHHRRAMSRPAVSATRRRASKGQIKNRHSSSI